VWQLWRIARPEHILKGLVHRQITGVFWHIVANRNRRY